MAKLESAKQLSKEVLDDIEFFVKDATSMTVWGCVEKQIPKKIVEVKNSDIPLLPRCPTCKCSVNYNQEYCSICGQHLAPTEDFNDLINEL